MLAIFPQWNVDLLKETYESVHDIDLVVGSAFESFASFDTILTGETIGCIVGEQYRHVMGGDAYFYSHESNPYPFTPEQLEVIRAYTFSHLFCQNSEVESIPRIWLQAESEGNPKVNCDDLEPLDLSAWSNV